MHMTPDPMPLFDALQSCLDLGYALVELEAVGLQVIEGYRQLAEAFQGLAEGLGMLVVVFLIGIVVLGLAVFLLCSAIAACFIWQDRQSS